MNAFTLASKFLRWRAVATLMMILSIALAVGMVIALRSLPRAIVAGAGEPAVRFPVVLARGDSASRIVLAVAFLEPPSLPSLPRSLIERVAAAPGVREVLPIRVTHEEGLLVSTSRAYFHQSQGRLALSSGRFFEDPQHGTAVVGSHVAAETQLTLGGTITRARLSAKVVGVLAPTGTLIDEAVFVPLQPSEASISAIVVVPGGGFNTDQLMQAIDEPGLLVVSVEPTLRKLVGLVAAIEQIVDWLSWAVAALTLALVLSSFYSSVRERVPDLAVLRVLGARRTTVMAVLATEAAIVGGVGSALGLLVGEALLSTARSALSAAGFAFTPQSTDQGLRIVLAGALVTVASGLAVATNAYRMDPVRALTGVHRPWPEVLSPKGQARLRRLGLAVLLLFVVLFHSATPSPSNRLPNEASRRLFGLLAQWDANGGAPAEIAALDGTKLEVEGYQYVPFDGPTRRWRSSFFLVLENPNRPVELFHDEHRPEVNERIAVELSEPIEQSLYPIRVTGTFQVRGSGTEWGEALYHLVGASAKVLVFESD